MIKEFLTKKENIFIILIGVVSVFFVTLGFLFLFFNQDTDVGPQKIPSAVHEIVWDDFKSKILDQKISHPEHMIVNEYDQESGRGVSMVEFQEKGLMTYFDNHNHVSIYPTGLDTQFFYGTTRESEYVSDTKQEFIRTEYLTFDQRVWAVRLVPKSSFTKWQAPGFVWIQSRIGNREAVCMDQNDMLITSESCDPYLGQRIVYSGAVSDDFIEVGYEIVDKNYFQ